MKRRYKRNRKDAVPHTVRKHTRKGRRVRSYKRGHGSPSRHVSSRRRGTRRSTWNPSNTADRRRRALLASIPKNMSEKRRLEICAERMHKISMNPKVDKTTRSKADSDEDYFREELYGQNPEFTPAQKTMIMTDMEENSNMGRSVDHTFRSFEKAHRAAEDELRTQGAAVTATNVESHMKRRFGFVDVTHGS